MTPEEIFKEMPANINPDAAKGMNSTIQFNLSGDNGGQWYVAIKDGKAEVSKGTASSPNMTLSMAAQDYVDMILGKLNGQMAFMSDAPSYREIVGRSFVQPGATNCEIALSKR